METFVSSGHPSHITFRGVYGKQKEVRVEQNMFSKWNKIMIYKSISGTDLFAVIFVYLTSIGIYDPFYGTRLSLLGIGNILSKIARGQINCDCDNN